MRIGVTGTRKGCTPQQLAAAMDFLGQLDPDVRSSTARLHHGDCVGVDAELHELALELGIKVVVHLPADDSHRAFCEDFHVKRKPAPYLDRNRNIVLETETLLAFPDSTVERMESGTWSTVRFARKTLHPVIIIVYPDGTMRTEGPGR